MSQLVTNDLSFAAYLIFRGCKLLTANRYGKLHKFVVETNEMQEHKLKVEYVNSESAKFDAAVRDLKKIMFSGQE